jgi:hypothetical protein
MRFRIWAGLTSVALGMSAGYADSVAAERDPWQTGDMIGMVEAVTRTDPVTGPLKPTFWFDIGAALPTGSFNQRQWTNGFALQMASEFWSSGMFAVDGRLGAFFNEASRYNEAQTDSFYNAGPGYAGGPLASQRHLLVPFSIEFKVESKNPDLAPFISFGPSINWARESTAYQDSTQIATILYVGDNWPTDEKDSEPPTYALSAQSVKNNTKINPGYAGTLGTRFRFNNTYSRLMLTLNTWYERSHPVSMVGAFISFGL